MELSNFDGGGAHRRRIVEEFPARGGLEPKAAGLGKIPGHEAELLRGSAEA
jgi:hypothetical protein